MRQQTVIPLKMKLGLSSSIGYLHTSNFDKWIIRRNIDCQIMLGCLKILAKDVFVQWQSVYYLFSLDEWPVRMFVLVQFRIFIEPQ